MFVDFFDLRKCEYLDPWLWGAMLSNVAKKKPMQFQKQWDNV